MVLTRLRRLWRLVAAVIVVIGILAIALSLTRPRFDEHATRRAVIATIQSDSEASFFVTGTLQITATSVVENTRYLFPDVFPLDLGTTTATVRMPGRIAYGFQIDELTPDHIVFRQDGVIEVALPPLTVFSVEPNLELMEVQTQVGWARTYAGSGQRATNDAIRYSRGVLRTQADSYLSSNAQPRINTAAALDKLLTPVLQAAGVSEPRFEYQIGPHIVLAKPIG